MTQEAKKKIERLRKEIREHNYLYYVFNQPKITDWQYDKLFAELKALLKTAYERMLYMGVLFFPLAWATYRGGGAVSRLFFLALIVLLFISNIPPRHKVMRLLERYGLSIKQLRESGIWL